MRKPTALLLFACVACNPVQKISENTNAIRSEARTLVEHGRQTNDDEVVQRASRIESYAAGIHESIADVENKTPAWMSMTTWLAIAAVAVAGLFALSQSGILTFVRIAIGWLPSRKVREAELAHKMISDDAETPREYVAARRGADVMFDAAWRKINNKEKPCTSSDPSNPSSVPSPSPQPASSSDTCLGTSSR